jgi:hypothetical protein
MKERRRRKARRMFLPNPTGDNPTPMTRGVRRVLNNWQRTPKKAEGAVIKALNKLLIRR